jgi:arsenate reductase
MTPNGQDHRKRKRFSFYAPQLCQVSDGGKSFEGYLWNPYEAYSAGVSATTFNPHALQVMKEIGIDISNQYSKTPKEFQDIIFDMAVTVCDRAKVSCPICSTNLEIPAEYPRAKEVIHKSFEDPTAAVGSEEEKLKVFRQVRDEIKDWMTQVFGK